jgi:uncharacterized protein YndB with AHSA1/START domain
MPAVLGAVASMGLTIDRETNTIRLVRAFNVPRAQIFEAWTQPEHVACWWDPAGDQLVECDIDLRPGGTFKFVSRGHADMPFCGTYREIARPDRLVFDALGSTGRVTLEEDDGETRMVVEIDCGTPEHLEQFLKMGVEVGTAQTLDNLVGYMARRRAKAS